MSAVSTAIQIQDRVTANMQKMNRALMVVINTMEKLNRVSAEPIDVAGLNEAREGLAEVEVAMEEVTETIRNAQEEQDKYSERVGRSEVAVGGLTSKIGTMIATYASVRSLKAALDFSDELTNTSARIGLMVRDGENVAGVNEKIYASANRTYSSYKNTADMVAKLGVLAADAFKSTDEIILFTEQLNKNFVISGTETAGIQAAMLQLTQAMASGVLRGEEFNSIMEQTPTVIKTIADYMGVSTGELKSMAGNGEVTAEVVKSALLAAADETDRRFQAMPNTFSDVMNLFKNEAIYALEPVWQRLRAVSDSEGFKTFAIVAGQSLGTIANIIVTVLNGTAKLGTLTYNSWSFVAPVIGTVIALMLLYNGALAVNRTIQAVSNTLKAIATVRAVAHGTAITAEMAATTGMTASQLAFNAALYACPLTWILLIIVAVIAAIYLVVAAINQLTGSSISATGIIAGAFAGLGAIVYNIVLGAVDLILGMINYMINPWVSYANFLANVFVDPIAAIIHLFGDMADNVLGLLESIAQAIDKIFGSNLADAVSGWRSGLGAKVDNLAETYGNGKYEKKVKTAEFSSSTFGLNRLDVTDSYNSGYNWAKGLTSGFGGFSGISDGELSVGSIPDYDTLLSQLDAIGDDTKGIRNSVDISEENLKYLRDLAEQDTINRFTTAEINIDMGGVTNHLDAGETIDGFMDALTDKMYESMVIAAEGVHE
nr:MAG TPA: Tail tape measure [Caudoviricetes sp.]